MNTETAAADPIRAKPDRNPISGSGLCAAAGAAVCLFTLTGFAGSWFWMFEVTSHFRVQYAVILLMLSLAFLLIRQRRTAAVFLMFGLLNGWLLLPFLGPTPVHSATRLPSIRLLAWNVNSANDRFSELTRLIGEQQPDAVLLMEVSPKWARFLAAGLTNYPHRLVDDRDDNFGIAFLGRTASGPLRTVYLGEAGLPSIEATIRIDGGEIAFLGTHPLPPAGALRARLRDDQLDAIVDWTLNQTLPTMVVGDLNITPWSPVFEKFVQKAGLENSANGRGLHATWPAFFKPMLIPIDHCLHTAKIRISRREILPATGSDHLPQLIEIQLADESTSMRTGAVSPATPR